MRVPVPAHPDYPVECKTLGDHMRKTRIDKGLSQAKVATLLNVTEGTVTGWELGHHAPQVPQRARIIRFLGFDPSSEADTTLGQRIIAYRARFGLTQKELAEQLDIDPTTLSRLERDQGKRVHRTTHEKITALVGQA